MIRYKVIKKPAIVEAYQVDTEVHVHTLEGIMKANKGDWIITGIFGEQYPVKKEIFEKTYTILGEKDGKL